MRCVFPFERLVDLESHPTLVRHTATSSLVGQFAFGAAPAHPFLAAILRALRRASLDEGWARVPTAPAGDEDDTKTVLYTTGPALVTRAFFDGGFGAQVGLMYAPTARGPADPLGWGRFGGYGAHLHAGTWKVAAETNAPRLLARAANHTHEGRHRQAAALLLRAMIHHNGSLDEEAVDGALGAFVRSYVAIGRRAEAVLRLAREWLQAKSLTITPPHLHIPMCHPSPPRRSSQLHPPPPTHL